MSQFIFVPRDAAVVPASGECIHNSFWAVHPEKGLAFYRHPGYPVKIDYLSPQCNSDERVSKLVVPKMLPDCEIIRLDMVFMTSVSRWLEEHASEMRVNS